MADDTMGGQVFSIGAVERDTGLSKDTLRVWERRYGFPQPVRDAHGERVYPLEQLERLRVIKRLLDQGYRPGKIVGQEMAGLLGLVGEPGAVPIAGGQLPGEREDLLHYILLCKAYQFDQLRRELSQALVRMGLQEFVMDIVAPLNGMVGARWANGTFAVFEEHLYTESMQIVLRNAIASVQRTHADGIGARVLLTTFPQEQHSLGLLMAEAIFSLEGARCISLGVQTPVPDIALAAATQHADIVALSFSAAMNPKQLATGLQDLRARLAGNIEIWAGGACAGLQRRPLPDVRVLGLQDIGTALAEWQSRHAAPA
ncbi:MerR family transcriptional regulator [Oxalobacteraceae bacterium OM1]|nr:MerR family transcriptional regulator [Oxalobacteraceae bacterium OM1]